MTSSRRRWPELLLPEWPWRDRAAWAAITHRAGPLDDSGPAAGFARTTLRTMRSIYGGVLFWLAERGELDPDAGPADRLTPERFVAYLAARRASASDNTVFNNIRMLTLTLNCLAPEHDWSWLRRHPHAPTRHEAAAARRHIRPVQPGVLLAGLLMRLEAMQREPVSELSALRVRNLLMVAVCTCTALRLRNLVELTLGSSIFRHGGGFEIRYGAGAIKNEKQATMRLMPELSPYLDLYLATFRPALLRPIGGDADGALWVTQKGRRITHQRAQVAFKHITVEVQGWAANPQSFRHSAVTELLHLDPRQLDVAAALLAHKASATTGTFYDLSADKAARAKWQELVRKYLPVRRRDIH